MSNTEGGLGKFGVGKSTGASLDRQKRRREKGWDGGGWSDMEGVSLPKIGIPSFWAKAGELTSEL